MFNAVLNYAIANSLYYSNIPMYIMLWALMNELIRTK